MSADFYADDFYNETIGVFDTVMDGHKAMINCIKGLDDYDGELKEENYDPMRDERWNISNEIALFYDEDNDYLERYAIDPVQV